MLHEVQVSYKTEVGNKRSMYILSVPAHPSPGHHLVIARSKLSCRHAYHKPPELSRNCSP